MRKSKRAKHQLEYAGVVNDGDAKADYSFVEYWLPNYQQRKAALEQEARELVRNHWVAVSGCGGGTLQTSCSSSG